MDPDNANRRCNGRAQSLIHPLQADVDRFNAVADEEMAALSVGSKDLHAMTLNFSCLEVFLWRDHAHFHHSVYEAQGQWLAV